MVIYAFAIDYGLNGHEIISVHDEKIDPEMEFRQWQANNAARGLMQPYTTGYSLWRIDGDTGEIEELP
ncbi:MAG TPA: hypothetical protein VF516_12390 [Kofleriaceae bacterium]